MEKVDVADEAGEPAFVVFCFLVADVLYYPYAMVKRFHSSWNNV